jgi:hypothetical protein
MGGQTALSKAGANVTKLFVVCFDERSVNISNLVYFFPSERTRVGH